MNMIQNFGFEEHLIRAVERNGNPWFVGKDICTVLDISKHHQALETLDDDERGTCIVGTPSGDQSMIVISEAGVYRLVFRSRKPEAERFKRWLAHEVLPQIRRTGQYQAQTATPSAPPAPVDEVTRKLAMITEARMTHGPAFAAALWRQLGLPEPGRLPPPSADPDALACLRHLLRSDLGGQTVGALLVAAFKDDRAATQQLKGLKIEIKGDGFTVPNVHAAFAALYEGTEWARPFEALRKLPGAKPHLPYGGRFAGEYTFIPSHYLDEA